MKTSPAIMADFGPQYFNPVLGHTASETFANISNVMQFLFHVHSSNVDINESQSGITLLIQTVWSAAQYEETRRSKRQKGDAE